MWTLLKFRIGASNCDIYMNFKKQKWNLKLIIWLLGTPFANTMDRQLNDLTMPNILHLYSKKKCIVTEWYTPAVLTFQVRWGGGGGGSFHFWLPLSITPGIHFSLWMRSWQVWGFFSYLSDTNDTVWCALICLFHKGFGYADVENQTRMTEDSLLATGSVSKLLTTLAVARLMDQGKLDIDKPIQEYLPNFPVKKWNEQEVNVIYRFDYCPAWRVRLKKMSKYW